MGLREVTIDSDVFIRVGDNAFKNAELLKIIFPHTTDNLAVGANAFNNCADLAHIEFRHTTGLDLAPGCFAGAGTDVAAANRKLVVPCNFVYDLHKIDDIFDALLGLGFN
jgi:hypothetical protein